VNALAVVTQEFLERYRSLKVLAGRRRIVLIFPVRMKGMGLSEILSPRRRIHIATVGMLPASEEEPHHSP
jgi:hypothetical protein